MDIPSNKFSYRLRAADSKGPPPNAPRYAFLNNTGNTTVTDVSALLQCVVEFDITANLDPSVLFYYKLTNFFQNHRRYVKSLDSNQLKGKFVSPSTLSNGDCKPLGTVGGKDGVAIYPCGLIANSLFNGWVYTFLNDIPRLNTFTDTFTSPVLLNPSGSPDSSQVYVFSSKGIAWPGEAKKYTASPIGPGGYPNLSSIVPPPNWQLRFPENYTEQNPPPDLSVDEHFQNWMRTAGLPTFTKLYGRNDTDTMQQGTYSIIIGLSEISFPCTFSIF